MNKKLPSFSWGKHCDINQGILWERGENRMKHPLCILGIASGVCSSLLYISSIDRVTVMEEQERKSHPLAKNTNTFVSRI